MDEARGLRGLIPAAALDGEADADPGRDADADRGVTGSRSRGEDRNAAEARTGTGMPEARGERVPGLELELPRGDEDEARVDDAERRGDALSVDAGPDGEAARVVERERAVAPPVTGTGIREPERAGLNSSFFAARSWPCSCGDEPGEGEREREGERATVAGMVAPAPEPAGRRCVAAYFSSSCCSAASAMPPPPCCCSSAARTCRYCGRGVGLPSGRRDCCSSCTPPSPYW